MQAWDGRGIDKFPRKGEREYASDEELLVLCILTVPSDLSKMTANVKAPLIINGNTRKGCQIIVNNDDYSVRMNVYDILQSKKEESGC